MNARPREFLMQELREAQKALIAAKKRRNRESENYLRTRIGELLREIGSVR